MTENEKNIAQNGDVKQKIRERYRGVDASELEIIPAKPLVRAEGKKMRVAAYCRVSTENEEQTSSFELQKNYFTEYISNQPDWELVGIYADEGISGTQMHRREGLMKLLTDCQNGLIDIIITKSIARFARNTAECLTMIDMLRKLKPPVEVIFEADHISTMSGNDSLILSIMAALAETESYNKSVIMKWSVENRFKKGIFLLPELLGYDKDEDGNLVINDDEADTVRLCFYLFLAGFTTSEIADLLTDLGRKTGYKKQHNMKPGVEPEYKTIWDNGAVINILRNERHCGDVLGWKTCTEDFKTHKKVKNTGQRIQVRKRDDHKAIVSRAVFEAVNMKLDMMYGNTNKPMPTLQVIGGGLLNGYVPVHRNWAGFTAADFNAASESVVPTSPSAEKAITGTFEGFKPLRGLLFESTRSNPALTISKGKFSFNSACMKRFGNVEYVEMLFNSVEKTIAIRPCEKSSPNAIHWGTLTEGRWAIRYPAYRGFARPLFEIMGWDNDLRYRLRGSYFEEGTYKVMFFDLTEYENIETVTVDASDEGNGTAESVTTAPAHVDSDNDGEAITDKSSGEQEETDSSSRIKQRRISRIFLPEQMAGTTNLYYLERVRFDGNWDLLRPAKDVIGLNIVTTDEVERLLIEAEEIIDRLRVAS